MKLREKTEEKKRKHLPLLKHSESQSEREREKVSEWSRVERGGAAAASIRRSKHKTVSHYNVQILRTD